MTAPAAAPVAPGPEVEVSVEDARWDAALADAEGLARRAAALAFAVTGTRPEGLSVSFLFADDATLADLNARFRGRPAPTNVLSWPAWELRAEARGAEDGAPPDPPPHGPGPDGEAESLGDVALGHETVVREAEAAGMAIADHALHLAVHGVLHLLGHDHGRDADAALMEGLESRAMLAAGLRDPYVAVQKPGAARDPQADPERSDGD